MKTTPLVDITISYISGKIEVSVLSTAIDPLPLYAKLELLTDDDDKKISVSFAAPSSGLFDPKIQSIFQVSYPVTWEENQEKVAQESIDKGNYLLRQCLNIVIGEGIERNEITMSGNIYRM